MKFGEGWMSDGSWLPWQAQYSNMSRDERQMFEWGLDCATRVLNNHGQDDAASLIDHVQSIFEEHRLDGESK